ncbi:MAG: 3-isopropylmalate dehydratase small subunit [Candidatus Coatesbacteria bacterium]|nr:MAG: 3-isopropylmalate dehydratase small subunit [Candidatus Coatesbacteria bacterium]
MIKGKVWKYGDDVNTDVLFPGRYTYTVTDPQEMASHMLEDLDRAFAKGVKPGDIIVAGKNFGCGSSREQAALGLKYAGVTAVVAASFARIYFRNALNAGLPAVVAPEAVAHVASGDEITLDFEAGELTTADGTVFPFPPLPAEVLGILEAGGLVPYVRKELARK